MTNVKKSLANLKKALKRSRLAPSLALVAVVLVGSWMGYARGGYFAVDWGLAALALATLALISSVIGALRAVGYRQSARPSSGCSRPSAERRPLQPLRPPLGARR